MSKKYPKKHREIILNQTIIWANIPFHILLLTQLWSNRFQDQRIAANSLLFLEYSLQVGQI